LAYLRELAAFRESYAKTRNIPRNRVFKDDAMIELASTKPATQEDLNKSRLLLREARKGDIAEGNFDSHQNGECHGCGYLSEAAESE
jgi:ribonuclease D